MELVELLYDKTTADNGTIHATIAATAEQLGVRPIDIAVTLSERHPYP
ncbi:hypothetical protein ACFXHA_18830 [Nocardia sp. NPDC059240]